MVKVKICGINDAGIARRAEDLGADYLGFIFADGSPRRVMPGKAAEIATALSGRARRVGVFTGGTAAEMLDVARMVPLDVVQLHGKMWGTEDVRALKESGLEVWTLDGGETRGDAVVVDGVAHGLSGGTGKLADWGRVATLKAEGVRVVLAGGISAGNVRAAVETGCDVIDVNSSLETGPGVKSAALVEGLFSAFVACRLE